MNTKSLTISISSSSSYTEDDDDIFAPPSSPPPPHLICIPERNNAGMNSWQQNKNYVHQQNPYSRQVVNNSIPADDSSKPRKNSLFVLLRRQLFLFAKKSIKILLQNNNLLLIANVVNKLWKARASFVNPLLFIIKNTVFVIKHQGYKNLLKYTIHYIKHIFTKQQHQFISSKTTSTITAKLNNRDPLTTIILVLATTSHLLVIARKIMYKWLSNTVTNMGGLDSIILAISAIAFAKTIQKSDRIF